MLTDEVFKISYIVSIVNSSNIIFKNCHAYLVFKQKLYCLSLENMFACDILFYKIYIDIIVMWVGNLVNVHLRWNVQMHPAACNYRVSNIEQYHSWTYRI